ncbi:hypothetical protein MNEG_13932 [Monoraphidium neglectum]|uniref:Uncharacterized protein n=1 Tax=Monoraphidium neglectum TaxID=145388 RepID=A0A0D2MG10_9CHLO|nr:hypothetical protein MNEG_13932 [Monoraphidium neglectum]KIY94030.1 hypothetical protein MNEG_13932 [Monoraphidium neglectum]|eukprot:XP_013893050.1 hypothetical protein MNEG_13932 [Monoraphidium neglectum]
MGCAVLLFLAGSGRYSPFSPAAAAAAAATVAAAAAAAGSPLRAARLVPARPHAPPACLLLRRRLSPMARVVKVVTAAMRSRLRPKTAPQAGSPIPGYTAIDSSDPDDNLGISALRQPGPYSPAGGGPRSRLGGGGGGAAGRQTPRPQSGGSKSYRWLEDAITEWADSQGAPGSHAGGGVGGYTRKQARARGSGRRGPGRGMGWGAGGAESGARGVVEEVKLVLRLLPIFWTTAIYWTLYGFMGTFFIAQGSLMDNAISIPWPFWGGGGGGSPTGGAGRRLLEADITRGGGGGGDGPGGDENGGFVIRIPSATMALFNTGAIILLVPLYDKVVDPWLTKMGRKLTLLQKIGWGMMVAALAMLYAAGIESWRLSLFRSSHGGDDPGPVAGGGDGGGGGDYERVAINIMWQSPAYILVGASEVLASVGQLEFFYDQARRLSRFGGPLM